MSGGNLDALGAARARIRREINVEQRRLLDLTDTLGILVVGLGVPFFLWDHIGHGRLLLWGGVLLTLTLVGGPVTTRADSTNRFVAVLRTMWIWGTSILWAALPWLDPSAVETGTVAWILVFVVVYGIASDVIFLPQTDDMALVTLLSGYASSFVIALLVARQWGAAVAVVGFLALLTLGGRGWRQLIGLLTDKRIESELHALVDELTGVGTRVTATLAVEELRTAGVDDVHCMILDIDDFEKLNDTYGYPTGDTVLKTVAQTLCETLPAEWQVARLGGDEFVAVGSIAPELHGMRDVCVRLPGLGSGSELTVAVSIGTTALPAAEAGADDLFREANAALRIAKSTGKHRVVEMTARLRAQESQRLALGAATSAALETREIVAYAQAITDLHTGLPVGAELLARWPQDDGSIVMPDDFIPVIEQQGRGPQLGDLMMRYAVDLVSAARLAGGDQYATVNLSARHLFHRNLPTEVDALVRSAGIPAERLVLEITESQHLPQSSIWRTTAEELREIGVGLAIDDFGTGYSSMEQLLSMPFSHLKVDRIITSSQRRPGVSELAAAIAAMAHGGGMTAIAEGIETEVECDQMIAAGYRYGQGFLFGKPQPLDELLDEFTSMASDTTSPVQQ